MKKKANMKEKNQIKIDFMGEDEKKKANMKERNEIKLDYSVR